MKIKRIAQGLLLVGILASLFFSCKKDDIESENKDGILLSIEPNHLSYIGENGNPYYSNSFLSKSDTNLYRLSLESGVRYHIYCVQPNRTYSNIGMVLLNSSRDTVTVSTSEDGNPMMFFDSNVTGEFYLSVFLKNSYNESLSYNLYFETSGPQPLSFMGKDWDYTGGWEAIDTNTLKFKCVDSRWFRWMRLSPSFDNFSTVSFTIKSSSNSEATSFGFIWGGSSKLLNWGDYKDELPQNSIFFNIMGKDSYRILDIGESGISFNYGNFEVQKFDLAVGVGISLINKGDDCSIFINDIFIRNVRSGLMNKLYLAIEDSGFGDITLENLIIE